MHRAISRRQVLIGWLAEKAGHVYGVAMRSVTVRSIPGAGGAVLVALGLGEIYHPLLWVAAGLFLLVLDNRMG
jgi:hypothetical protein